MKQLSSFLVLLLLIAGIDIHAQKRVMQLHRGSSVVAEYDISNVDSVTFVEVASQEEIGVVINGIRWATRNVDAPGTFAALPESLGMFYQWNKNIGWSSTDPIVNSYGGTTWDGVRPSGTTWEKAKDPCPEGWRVPTRDELQSLRDAGSSLTIQNGVRGRLFGIEQGVWMFMPAAGFRQTETGKLFYVDTYGFYWSSTQSGSAGAYILYFSNISMSFSYRDRTYGHPLRCVAE